MMSWNRRNGGNKAARTRRINKMKSMNAESRGTHIEKPTIIGMEVQYNTPPALGGNPFRKATSVKVSPKKAFIFYYVLLDFANTETLLTIADSGIKHNKLMHAAACDHLENNRNYYYCSECEQWYTQEDYANHIDVIPASYSHYGWQPEEEVCPGAGQLIEF